MQPDLNSYFNICIGTIPTFKAHTKYALTHEILFLTTNL